LLRGENKKVFPKLEKMGISHLKKKKTKSEMKEWVSIKRQNEQVE